MDFLDFKPALKRTVSPKLEKSETLDFQMTWLNSSNFKFLGEHRLEIHNLLNFCQFHFPKEGFAQ